MEGLSKLVWEQSKADPFLSARGLDVISYLQQKGRQSIVLIETSGKLLLGVEMEARRISP